MVGVSEWGIGQLCIFRASDKSFSLSVFVSHVTAPITETSRSKAVTLNVIVSGVLTELSQLL